MTESTRQNLSELLGQLAAGDLTVRQAHALDQVLAGDKDARDYYLDFMSVEAELHAKHSFESHADATSTTSGEPKPAAKSLGLLRSLRLQSWLTLAAGLMGVAVISSLLTAGLLRGDAAKQVAVNGEPQAGSIVGAISATRNCRWTTHDGGYGDLIRSGQRLSLQQGVAEITFNSGAKALLEGPAQLQIADNGQIELCSGRLAVDSPLDIQSLPIRSGRITIQEQGAAFGLIAEASGAGQVHVFRGVVHATLTNRSGERLHACELTSGSAGKLGPSDSRIEPIAAIRDLFVRSLSPGSGARDGLYALDGFNYAAGPLGEQNGGFGWAGAWQDIETTDGPEGGSTNVVQNRSLNWPGIPTLGGSAYQDGQANRTRRVLSMSVKGVFDTAGYVENRDAHRLIGQQGKTIYLAFLQSASKTDDVFYGVELNRGDGNGNRVLCIGNGVEESGYSVTSNYNDYINDTALPLGEENTDVNLFVVRIDFGENDHDRATVYRNPASLMEEKACEPTAVLQGNFAFDRISLGNFNGTKIHEVDDLRVGADFRVVTGQRSFMQGQLARGLTPHRRIASDGGQAIATLASWPTL